MNETRHIKFHETCKCICRLHAIVCNDKQRWNNDKCWSECKGLIDKDVCDKGFTWNLNNCDCDCDKPSDVGGYLEYRKCKCRKRQVDKLVDECTENIDEEVKILDKNESRCSSCILYIVLFSIFFMINIGIATYFISCEYVKHAKENVSGYDYVYQAKYF